MVHVLVADDEEKVRNVIADALRLAGYTVAEACNGREAVACFIAAPTDIVLMDLLMPVKDGIEALQKPFGLNTLITLIEELARA
ncbi:MAG: response regulator [bacterium]|nr:response regulator [bacterium]